MGVSEQITTRFGALDSRLAKAVRHALDVAVTFTALTRLNDVHLRIAAMGGTGEPRQPVGEPPSHNWREFVVDIFGRNPVGTRRSPVGLRTSGPNAISLDHAEFAASYRPSARERGTVHALVAAASAFVVAEATGLADLLDVHEPARGGSQLVDDLAVTLQQVGQVGVRLAEVAAEGSWATLLTDRVLADVPVPSPRSVALVPRTGSTDLCRPARHRDRVVLMVDPMDSSRQRTLTKHALVTIGESMARRGDSAPPTLVVMSTVSTRSPVPVDLVIDNKAERHPPFRHSEEWITRTLDRVSRAVETVSHDHTGPRRSFADAARKRDRPFESLQTAVRHYRPLMLVVLANSTSMNFSDRYLVNLNIRHGSPPARATGPEALNGVSVAVISYSPPEVDLRSLTEAWSAAGAGDIEYRCLASGEADGDAGAEDYLASYVTRRNTGALVRLDALVDDLPPVRVPSRRLRSRVLAICAVFVAATTLAIATTLTWGVHAVSTIVGLVLGLSSGVALTWSAREWRKLGGPAAGGR